MLKLYNKTDGYKGKMGSLPPRPLAMIENGRRVRLISVQAGQALQSRLTAMGLAPGAKIEVIRNLAHGPFVIAVKDNRIMLGRGMALKIIVE